MKPNEPVPEKPKSALQPHQASFDGKAKELLEHAIRLRADGRALSSDTVREFVSALCDDARGRNLAAERLLVDLKRAWYLVPEASSHEKGEVISVLVTMCIREYYRDGTDSGPKR